LAEQFAFQSPFVYAANNPIRFIDYMGMNAEEPDEEEQRRQQEQEAARQAEQDAMVSRMQELLANAKVWDNSNFDEFLQSDTYLSLIPTGGQAQSTTLLEPVFDFVTEGVSMVFQGFGMSERTADISAGVSVFAGSLLLGRPKIRNISLAGKVHPKTGVPFTKQGFPDFKNSLYKGKNDVFIKPTGTRAGDYDAANKAAGFSSKPKGYVWHHHETKGRMQLVKESVHLQTGHTGGFSLWYP
jgi:hypothetical protein